MPRRPRVNLVGYPQHIVQRGHNRAATFFADDDYHCYLHSLKDSATKYGCDIHAYALMTNHVHLLVSPNRADGITRLMQSLGRRYAQYVNRFYKRSGSVWEGRFKASVIDAEEYLITCYRYIELNPVTAGMVSDPADYRWTSYRWHGLGERNELITDHPLYQALAQDDMNGAPPTGLCFVHLWIKRRLATYVKCLTRGNRWALSASANRSRSRWASGLRPRNVDASVLNRRHRSTARWR